jgi:alanyl-tRNA synthetase
MKTAEIREAFLRFFEEKNHTIVTSSTLIPQGDPTLLFANAGMVQFKDTFLGSEKRSYSRATSCQKCLRISGKHNDLENVGRTARHHTFFEMLGNFSFGDYFKEDAIALAWEFVTENLELSKDRLWVTVFEDDDEAAGLWKSKTDVRPERVLRCGEKDNFWAMGDTGPCGPCSEIFYYLGDDLEGQSEEEFRLDDGTYIEIWNLVFMQFNRDNSGALNPLPKPSVDTGMGLERVAAVKQGKKSNYDSDLLRAIIAKIEKLSSHSYLGVDYRERSFSEDSSYAIDVAMRVICDHARACAFLIADGVNPGSDGRGYVVRRLIRRASRYGKMLGFEKPFIHQVAETVIELMSASYPELNAQQSKILKQIKEEESKFLTTLDNGLGLLTKEVEQLKLKNETIFPGEAAFRLHDTYGFPLDMTEDILRTEGLVVDSEGFSEQMELQRERSRSARSSETQQILQRSVSQIPCEFVGYDFEEYESKVLGLFNAEGPIETAAEGDEIALVAEKTPFYGESGGQVGDTGSISSNSASLDVIDTQKVGKDTIVHIVKVQEGAISKGDSIRLAIDASRRAKLRVHHSATHLLHSALKNVLGDHVAQAGSRVSERNLRFDFSHPSQVSTSELLKIETLVNQDIRCNFQILTEVLPLEDAQKKGATALFGEKYGDTVRVVEMGPQSLEFCGGTHASRTGDIGLFKIVSESAVQSGVRRIEALAGLSAFESTQEQSSILKRLSGALKVPERDLEERVAKILSKSSEYEKEVEGLKQKLHLGGVQSDNGQSEKTLEDGTKVITKRLDEASPKQLREVADHLRNSENSCCIALASVSEGKAVFLTAITSDLTQRYHAGEMIKEISKITGGKGGGKADLAQAGGGDPSKIDEGLRRFEDLLG